uniref:peptidylprolyl isomerase n=1 Tax=Ciona savignyi TaxID=51511 RepID=H2Y9R4_CIOSA
LPISNKVATMSESPPAIDVSQPQDGGVMKVIKTAGIGEERPMSGSKVTVHYTGKLLDGTIFDSSHNHGSKFTFNLGKGEVIKAWDWGVASMRKGEICELTCKPQYAYGERGSPPKIPPNATLIFEVELFEWEGEDLTDEKGVIREILEEGSDYASPNDGAEVEVAVVGKYLGKVFDDRTVKYNVGEGGFGGDEQLPPAIDLAVKKMKRNERCRIKVAPKYGFGTTGSDVLGVPPSANLTYELRLMSFERAKEAWECSDEERMEQAELAKKKGTDFVKEQNYKRAIVQYKKIAELLSHHDAKEDGSDEDRETIGKWNKLKLAGYLNVALCQNKEKLYLDAVHSCEEALKLEATSEKAIYRLAEGLFGLKEYHKAKVQFNKV